MRKYRQNRSGNVRRGVRGKYSMNTLYLLLAVRKSGETLVHHLTSDVRDRKDGRKCLSMRGHTGAQISKKSRAIM